MGVNYSQRVFMSLNESRWVSMSSVFIKLFLQEQPTPKVTDKLTKAGLESWCQENSIIWSRDQSWLQRGTKTNQQETEKQQKMN